METLSMAIKKDQHLNLVTLADMPLPLDKLHNISLFNRNLTELYLSNTCLGKNKDGLANFFKSLSNSKTILVLDISGNEIGDQGAKALGSYLDVDRKLLKLNIANNSISEQGAEEICEGLQY
jgi:Ran GTPase-activating protein (RanGAP) involved in mRNA processing and transport